VGWHTYGNDGKNNMISIRVTEAGGINNFFDEEHVTPDIDKYTGVVKCDHVDVRNCNLSKGTLKKRNGSSRYITATFNYPIKDMIQFMAPDQELYLCISTGGLVFSHECGSY